MDASILEKIKYIDETILALISERKKLATDNDERLLDIVNQNIRALVSDDPDELDAKLGSYLKIAQVTPDAKETTIDSFSDETFLVGDNELIIRLINDVSRENDKISKINECDVSQILSTKDSVNIIIDRDVDIDLSILCDELTQEAKKTNIVDLIVKRNGKITGYNVLCYGLSLAMDRANIDVKGKTVYIDKMDYVGISFSHVFEKRGANICESVDSAQIIVSKGESEDEYPLKDIYAYIQSDISSFRSELAVIAMDEKVRLINPLYLQCARAKKIYELISNKTLSKKKIDEVYKKYSRTNIDLFLVGMPSCGKSACSRTIGTMMSRFSLDTDKMIKDRFSMEPAKIIENFAEDSFRVIESYTIRSLKDTSSVIVSTGGGCVTRRENIFFMKKLGVICYVRRDLSLLTTKNRPLSKAGGVEALYEKRHLMYEFAGDYTVENNGTVFDTSKDIVERFYSFLDGYGRNDETI